MPAPAVIEGTLPGDALYEGEQVYLLPLRGATAERVDSATVSQNSFRFEREASPGELYILRTRPALRLRLQELLVVVEAGHLLVSLDTVSSARGTALNDSLQQWKEHVWMRGTEAYARYNYTFVRHNKDNVVGQFVYEQVKGLFSTEEKQTLNMP